MKICISNQFTDMLSDLLSLLFGFGQLLNISVSL